MKKETTTPNTVAAYDCSSPTSMQTFGFEERCEKPDMDSAQEPTTITILQRIKEVKFSGYRCHMTKATTRYICGAWSYNKYLPDAIGHVPVPLTGSFCANLIQRKIYKDVRGDRHKVAVPGVTEISLTEKGYEGVDKGDESSLDDRSHRYVVLLRRDRRMPVATSGCALVVCWAPQNRRKRRRRHNHQHHGRADRPSTGSSHPETGGEPTVSDPQLCSRAPVTGRDPQLRGQHGDDRLHGPVHAFYSGRPSQGEPSLGGMSHLSVSRLCERDLSLVKG